MNILHLIFGLFAMMIALLFLSESVRSMGRDMIYLFKKIYQNNEIFGLVLMIGGIGALVLIVYLNSV